MVMLEIIKEMDWGLRPGLTKLCIWENGKTMSLMARESLLTLLVIVMKVSGLSLELKDRENMLKVMEIRMWDVGILMNHQDSASR